MSNRLAFQTQLASIMEILANAAVAEICKLVDDDYAVVSLQMSQCRRENKALKRKLHLLELKMARGNAERRLRESAMNNGGGGGGRPRVQINAGDGLRESSPSTVGLFDRQIDASLWSGRPAAEDATGELIRSDDAQSKSPDVELVEPEAMLVKEEKVEANASRAEETQEDTPLIGDDGMAERVPCQRPGIEQHGTQSTSGLSQSQSQSQLQSQSSQSSKMWHTGYGGRGAEEDEDQDVVLVKVEEVEQVTATGRNTGLSIQEGLVESSTDDHRAALPFDETTQTSTHQLPDLQESGRGITEVSYGHSSLWTNDGDVPLSYLPATLLGVESGHSESGLAFESSARRGLAGEGPGGFHASVSFQPPVIDLSAESGPVPGLGQTQGPQQYLAPGLRPAQGGYSGSQVPQQRIPKKKGCVCSFCGKVFSSQANLESHLRTHTGERPYGCSVCGKKFSQFWNLKIHKNIHTGERPYQCSLCYERFSDPSNLKKHQKRHHPQT